MDTPEQLIATHPHSILFQCIAGDHAYGTANAQSGEQTRGIFFVPDGLTAQVSNEQGNVVYYSLWRVIELLTQADPNILELLFMPDDCVLHTSPEMEQLIAARDIFVSKQCADTAMSQFKTGLESDANEMMQALRLLMSGRSLLATGRPIVRFMGAELELLLTIRAGKRSFEEIMTIAEAIMDECERLKKSAALPEQCDSAAAGQLLQAIQASWKRRHP
jgi:predicted nucleotidyltransferase